VELVVSIERAEETRGTRASALLACPEASDLFSASSAASGARVSVGGVIALLVETVGIADACDELGDGAALSLVTRHREGVRSAVESCGGAVVCARGDVQIACFRDLDAARVAFDEVCARAAAPCAAHEASLGVRGALARGPALVLVDGKEVELFGRATRSALEALPRAGWWELIEPTASAASSHQSRASSARAKA
jgi:hypothetical protein